MATYYFRDYRKTDDVGYDLYIMLKDLHGKQGVRIVFDRDTYEVFPDCCFERNLFISNHGWNGLKRMAVLLENMQDVELDFSGSVLRVHGAMIHAGILGSRNVCLKNLVLENPQTQIMQGRVIAHGEDYIDLQMTHGKEQFHMRHQELVTDYMDGIFFDIWIHQEYNAKTGEFIGDYPLGIHIRDTRVEDLGEDKIRIYHVKRVPPIGNILILNATRRLACGIFCEDSADIRCENITVRSCMGMGFAAQLCENITLSGFHTRLHDGRAFTANADATHFVACRGKVVVENSIFECQLDDALNIHGMYTRVVKKTAQEIFVKEMHECAKGIRFFRKGDKLQILNPDSLIPYTEKTVVDLEYINSDMVRLVIAEDTDDVVVGDHAENITCTAELVFRGNTVRHTRARGMLVASKGKTVIENNHFISPGVAVLLEANGEYWYESGGTNDLVIQNNTFENCAYQCPAAPVIACAPRKKVEEGKYFHKRITVTGNRFLMAEQSQLLAAFDNVQNVILRDNTVQIKDGLEPQVVLHHVECADLQDDVKRIQNT